MMEICYKNYKRGVNIKKEVLKLKKNILKEIEKRIEKKYRDTRPQRIKKAYALDLLEDFDYLQVNVEDLESFHVFNERLLNGANDWVEYSYGGSSLIYNFDIVNRLELKQDWTRYNGGNLLREQAHYLKLACVDLYDITKEVLNNEE